MATAPRAPFPPTPGPEPAAQGPPLLPLLSRRAPPASPHPLQVDATLGAAGPGGVQPAGWRWGWWLRGAWRRALRSCCLVLLVLAMALSWAAPWVGARAAPGPTPAPNSNLLAWRAPFNRPSFYPLDRRPDSRYYRPQAEWIGRLILPSAAEAAAAEEDWTWLELAHAPPAYRHLEGRRLPLAWAQQPELRALVRLLTTPVRLDGEGRRLAEQGNGVPERLDGRARVGPLQSLAGARPHDDLTVRLEAVQVLPGDPGLAGGGGPPSPAVLRIAAPPVQISGRWMARVQLLEALPAGPGGADLYRVRHYDPARHGYGGAEETVRIPAQPPNRDGRRMVEPARLLQHPIGAAGWTLYGAPAADGIFTVQALLPMALVLLQSDQQRQGTAAARHYLAHDHWGPRLTRRGVFQRIALAGDRPVRPWAIGDHALLLHLFGGIGGPGGEATLPFTVTGHFALGEGEVIADPFGGEPRLALRYHQIYANNPDGIVAGSQDWSAWSGNLQRGWLGLRPSSDVLVREDPALLAALRLQAEVVMARYRSGDGRGVAAVSATTSCVQDSVQALWITVQLLRRGLVPGAAAPAAVRAQRAALLPELERLLAPFGLVRADWRHNLEILSTALEHPRQVAGPASFQRGAGLRDALLSLHSVLPRRGHDLLVALFLRRGGPLWILRTNQIPGTDPRYEPLAPTLLLGRLPLVGELQRRLGDALLIPPSPGALAWVAVVGLGYGALALGLGLASGFLEPALRWPRLPRLLLAAAPLLPMPALGEEVLFRALVLPHPEEGTPLPALLAWCLLGTGLFVLYHPLAGRLWYRKAERLFHDPRFLLQTALLGGATTLQYQLGGSLWPAVLLHWLAVVVWLERFGGRQRLEAGARRLVSRAPAS